MPQKKNLKYHNKPKNSLKALKKILIYMANYKIPLIIALSLLLIEALIQISTSYFIKVSIDNYLLLLIKKFDSNLYTNFTNLILFFIILYILGLIVSYSYDRIMVIVSNKTLAKINKDLFDKMKRLPITYFNRNTHGEIMGLYTNDVESIRAFISESWMICAFSIIKIIGISLLIIYYSWSLTLFSLFVFLITAYIVKNITKKSNDNFKLFRDQLHKINGYTEEMYLGSKIIKVFCYEKRAKEKFDLMNKDYYQAGFKANYYANMIMPIMGNILKINYTFVSIIGSFLISKNILSIGALLAFLNSIKELERPIANMTHQMNSILNSLSSAEKVFEVLEFKDENDLGKITLKKKDNKQFWTENITNNNSKFIELKGKIEFKNVMFKYDNNEKIILNKINLTADTNQKIALVGSTGSGKTTITSLINRFYDVINGEVLIDGINVNNIKKDDLRNAISVVLQDTHLFTASILENIRYGNLNATDEEVYKASKLANANQFIQNLPNKYNTILTSDASNLSQGERQLLSIARAIIANRPILILDEATSSIDTRTEKLIENALNTLMKGKTTFIIAHRLSTVKNSDIILVVENGNIIERGNHKELIDKKGRYYQLYNGMFELN